MLEHHRDNWSNSYTRTTTPFALYEIGDTTYPCFSVTETVSVCACAYVSLYVCGGRVQITGPSHEITTECKVGDRFHLCHAPNFVRNGFVYDSQTPEECAHIIVNIYSCLIQYVSGARYTPSILVISALVQVVSELRLMMANR